jgi:hypothetical protein
MLNGVQVSQRIIGFYGLCNKQSEITGAECRVMGANNFFESLML